MNTTPPFPLPDDFPAEFHKVRGEYLGLDGTPISMYEMMRQSAMGEAIIGNTYLSAPDLVIRLSTVNTFHNAWSTLFNRFPLHFESMVIVNHGTHPWDDRSVKYRNQHDAAKGHWTCLTELATVFHLGSKHKPEFRHEVRAPYVIDAPSPLDRSEIEQSGSKEVLPERAAESPGEVNRGDTRI